jgi:IPT/TIG domain
VSTPTPGAIAITSITPSTVTEGDVITIIGENFGSTLGDSNVTFDGVPAANIQSANNTTIVCRVPDIPSLGGGTPPSSVSVAVQVSNFVTSATRFITVHPFTTPVVGSIEVVYQDASPDPLTAGVDNDFKFRLISNASQLVPVLLTPTLTGPSWPVTLLNASKQPLTGNTIQLASTDSVDFFARVSVPTGTNGTAFQIGVSGSAPGLANASSGMQSLTMGQFADPDETFTLAPTSTTPSGALSGTTLSAKVNQELDVFMDGEFTVADSYEVTLTLVPPSAPGWHPDLAEPAVNADGKHIVTVSQADINNAPNHRAGEAIAFSLTPDSTATNAQIRIVVKGASATSSRTFTFDLHPHA